MSIRLLGAILFVAGLFLFLIATPSHSTGYHHHPMKPPPVIKPPPVKPPPIVKPPVVPPVVTPPVVPTPPPVVTPTPPVAPAPTPTPAPPPTQPAPAQQAGGAPASNHGAVAAGIAVAGTAVFFLAVICSKEKERGNDNWFTRWFCLDVKLPTQKPVPFDLGFPA